MNNYLSRQEGKGRNIEKTETQTERKFQYIFLAGRLYETARREEKIYVYS